MDLRSLSFLVLAVLASLGAVSAVQGGPSAGATIDSSWVSVQDAFVSMQDAYAVAGSVPQKDVDMLNQAIEKMLSAEAKASTDPAGSGRLAQEANSLAREVMQDMAAVRAEGEKQNQGEMAIMVATTAGAIVAAVLVFRFGAGGLWKAWLRLRKDSFVRVEETAKPKVRKGDGDNDGGNGNDNDDEPSIFTMEHVALAIVAVLLVGSLVPVSLAFIGGRPSESFSELGILGPGQKLSDYPRDVVSGQTIGLYAYVGNHVGEPMWYSVQVKLGDNATVIDPSPASTVLRFDKVLTDNGSGTYPLELTLTKTGLNQRIIFELWFFNSTTKKFDYTGLWTHLWVNLSAPPF